MSALDTAIKQLGYDTSRKSALEILMGNPQDSAKILQAIAMSRSEIPPMQLDSVAQPGPSVPIDTTGALELIAKQRQAQGNTTPVPQPVPTPAPPMSTQPGLPVRTPPPVAQPTSARVFNPNAPHAALIQKYFPEDQWANAQAVMMAESGGRADAVGDNFPIRGEVRPSYGLFQIRTFPDRPSPDRLQDPEENVKYAASMFSKQGWGPWTAAKKLGII